MFQRLRVTCYISEPMLGGPGTYSFHTNTSQEPIRWYCPHAQRGMSGDTTATKWEQASVFRKVPPVQGCNVKLLLEVMAMTKHPDKVKKRVKKGNYEEVESVHGWAVLDVFKFEPEVGTISINAAKQTLPCKSGPVDWSTIFMGSSPDDVPRIPYEEKEGSMSLDVTLCDAKDAKSDEKIELIGKSNANSDEPFVKFEGSPPKKVKFFDQGDGFDIYVDGARCLPSNTSMSRAHLELFSLESAQPFLDMEDISDADDAEFGDWKPCRVDSSVYCPMFELRKECRWDDRWDPTLCALITVGTVDPIQKTYGTIGFAVLNLFHESGKTTQPDNSSVQDYYLNHGAFQLPVYHTRPDTENGLSMSDLAELKRVPCATVLVRIIPAARTADKLSLLTSAGMTDAQAQLQGIIVPPPHYSSAVYQTNLVMPDAKEKKMYNVLHRRTDMKVQVIMSQIISDSDVNLEDFDAIQEWMMSEAGLRVPIKEDSNPYIPWKHPVLSPVYPYNPDAGFLVSVDGGHMISANKPCFAAAIYSLSPPGSYYQEFKLTNQVHVTTKLDLTSLAKSPVWEDGFTSFKNVPFSNNLVLIVDLKLVVFKKGRGFEVLPYGWTAVGVINETDKETASKNTAGLRHVNTGAFQLPLYEGEVPHKILEEIKNQKQRDGWDVALRQAVTDKNLRILEPASVIVRIVDGQTPDVIVPKLDEEYMDTSCIPEAKMKKYKYVPKSGKKMFGKNKDLERLIPKGQDKASFQQAFTKDIADRKSVV